MLLQQLVNGVTVGGIYAMIALGYSMVYGVLQIVNWAHADVLMIGTFIGMLLTTKLHMPLLAMVLLASFITAVISMGIERVAYRPIKVNRRMAVLVSALGVSTFLENLAQLVFGTGTQQFPTLEKVIYTYGNVSFSNIQIIILIVTAVMLAIFICSGLQNENGSCHESLFRQHSQFKTDGYQYQPDYRADLWNRCFYGRNCRYLCRYLL